MSAHHRTHIFNSEDPWPLCDKAHTAGTVSVGVALVQFVLTFIFPIASPSVALEVYSRNLTSVLALLIFGLFLRRWATFHAESGKTNSKMKKLKILAVLVTVAACVKVGISALYALINLAEGNLTGLYYAGDALVWIFVAAFFIAYSRRIIKKGYFESKRERLDGEFEDWKTEGVQEE